MKRNFPAIPQLDEAWTAHAEALIRGDESAADKFIADRAREPYRQALAVSSSVRPFGEYELLARAKIGHQYVVKIRWTGAKGDMVLQSRWSEADGSWSIIEVENLGVHSPWAGVPSLQNPSPRAGNSHA